MIKKTLILFAVLILALALVCAWFYQDLVRFEQAPLNIQDEGQVLMVKSGMNLGSVGNELESLGLLKDARYFVVLARWKNPLANIKAGEFLIPKGSRPMDVIDILVRGVSIEYSITLVEGWNFKQMMQAVNDDVVLFHELKGKSNEEIMSELGYDKIHPEGRFLPNTYFFPRGTTDKALLKRVYQTMERVLAKEWSLKAKNIPLKTPYEALILASIIEKETSIGSEREQISGVFTRRLMKGMRLQTDPTVIYGMGLTYQGNIRKKDLREDTPYNTYVHNGLTPTPISMPGQAAIHAALHPAKGTSLFFVASGLGGHTFSTTLKQHNRAVKVYLKQMRSK